MTCCILSPGAEISSWGLCAAGNWEGSLASHVSVPNPSAIPIPFRKSLTAPCLSFPTPKMRAMAHPQLTGVFYGQMLSWLGGAGWRQPRQPKKDHGNTGHQRIVSSWSLSGGER